MSRNSSQSSNQGTSRVWLLARGARRGRFPPRPGSVRPGAETGTQPDLTSWYIPLESGIGPAERRPDPPGILTSDRGQRRTGPAGAAMGTTASRRSGRRSSRLTNLLRSDDTDARNDILCCFGRSRRGAHVYRDLPRQQVQRPRVSIMAAGVQDQAPQSRDRAARPRLQSHG
jgi:hypothetical protein